jgi:hypothetical protein
MSMTPIRTRLRIALPAALAALFLLGGFAGFSQSPTESRPGPAPRQVQQQAQPQAQPTDPAPEEKNRLASDSARLLKLATELKAAVDKSTKDQLSVTVIQKADEVEKLARKVREEMRAVSQSERSAN